MAQSKSASGAKKNTAKKKKPIRREVGSIVCLALGLFTLIGYFVKDYWLIDWLCLYVFKGLFGWGFLVVPPCFLWAAFILGFHRGRPVAGRLVAIAFIPLLFGAAVSVIAIVILNFWGDALAMLFMKSEVNDPADIALTVEHGMAYLRIAVWGLVPFMVVQVYSGLLREMGETVAPMIASVASAKIESRSAPPVTISPLPKRRHGPT